MATKFRTNDGRKKVALTISVPVKMREYLNNLAEEYATSPSIIATQALLRGVDGVEEQMAATHASMSILDDKVGK